jgi:hypothetical protein
MVVQLRRDGCTAWCSLVTPCVSVFLPIPIDSDVPAVLSRGTATCSADSPWWRIKRLLDSAVTDWQTCWPLIRARWDAWERVLLAEAADYEKASRHERCSWVSNNVSRLLGELDELERECGLSSWSEPAGAASGKAVGR